MKVKELREMTTEELEQQIRETQKELFNLRLQQVSGQLENPARVKELRRSLARIKTIQNEKVER
ncbi:MAG: 50S ribosomal protein L29 [Kiritimatiellales bacterium]|nr:50S ribosomal protein L29 [Kiritimatiellales bacterium]